MLAGGEDELVFFIDGKILDSVTVLAKKVLESYSEVNGLLSSCCLVF